MFIQSDPVHKTGNVRERWRLNAAARHTTNHTLVYLHIFTLSALPLYIHRLPRAPPSSPMERKGSNQRSPLLWVAIAALLSQSLLIPVMPSALIFEDQKNFFYTTPPPAVFYSPPSYGSGGGHSTTPTPHHGGAPPANCGAPPSGGHHYSAPSTPTGHGGGYYHSPPTTPTITTPSPPYDPSSPPFTCTYWKSHPTLIWGLFGWWGTVGSAFGATNGRGFGANTNLLEALSNTRTDGFGELYREGTAALLNSMAHAKFPYTTAQVKDRFVGALSSNKAAAAQARLFKLANEGRIKSTV